MEQVTSNLIEYLLQNINGIIGMINLHGETVEVISTILSGYEAYKEQQRKCQADEGVII